MIVTAGRDGLYAIDPHTMKVIWQSKVGHIDGIPLIEKNPPPPSSGRLVSIKYATQLPTGTPTFAFFANHPKYVKDNYRNYLENKLRDKFDFEGVPINIVFREK
jgi:outer membrane protein assembly factor BamB